MASVNPFDLLDDDAEDPTQLLAAQQQKKRAALARAQSKKSSAPAQPPAAKPPIKTLPPAIYMRKPKNEGQQGGHAGRGGLGFNGDSAENETPFENSNGFSAGYSMPSELGDFSKAPYERPRGGGGGRRGGYNNGAIESYRYMRDYDRRSGSGRVSNLKRQGAGRRNWGTPADDIAPETEVPVNEVEKNEKPSKESPAVEEKVMEKELEVKEMTLEEYEKVLEKKRQALLTLKTEERKVNLDKDLQAMRKIRRKEDYNEIFAKLGFEKERRASVKRSEIIKVNPVGCENQNRALGRVRNGEGSGRNIDIYIAIRPLAIGDIGRFPALGVK